MRTLKETSDKYLSFTDATEKNVKLEVKSYAEVKTTKENITHGNLTYFIFDATDADGFCSYGLYIFI